MAYKSHIKAVEKYNKNNYQEIKLRVKTGKKNIIELYAKNTGNSLNNYINIAIDKQLACDGFKPEEQQAGDAAAAGDPAGETGEKQ